MFSGFMANIVVVLKELITYSFSYQLITMSKYLIITFFFVTNLLNAQSLKFGYVYEDYIIANFTETKNLQEEINKKKQALEVTLVEKSKVYQEKYAAYQALMKDVANTTTENLNAKLKEVQGLQQEFNDIQQKGEADIQEMAQTKFLQIQEKVRKAIKTVSTEKGYKYVIRKNLNPSGGETNTVLLYSANEKQDDLTDAVLIKLGTVPPKK